MLLRFVYLDEATLADYAAQIDGGIITETRTRHLGKKSVGGEVGVKIVKAKGDRGSEREKSQTLSDVPAAQFQRLLAVAYEDPDAIGWVEVLDPVHGFDGVGIGDVISWRCTLNVAEPPQLEAHTGASELVGKSVEHGVRLINVPDANGNEAGNRVLFNFAEEASVILGTDPESDWTLFGDLEDKYMRVFGIRDETLYLVGKVKQIYPDGAKRELVNPIDYADYKIEEVPGPAMELDVLAIYR